MAVRIAELAKMLHFHQGILSVPSSDTKEPLFLRKFKDSASLGFLEGHGPELVAQHGYDELRVAGRACKERLLVGITNSGRLNPT
jgi:hypothetical protein